MNDNSPDRMGASGMLDISIILCTRNRAAKLSVTLECLKSLRTPEGYSSEIIVVDNGSADETASLCQSFATTSSVPFRREYLSRAGISRARNAGIRASAGRVLAFLDDDIHPQPDWLLVIAREFTAEPSLGILCGRVELEVPEDFPFSIRNMESRKYFNAVDDAFYLSAGGNFAGPRSLFDRIGVFDPEFGAGSRFYSAEDVEFAYRAWRNGEKILYVPEMLVLHDHGRRSPESQLEVTRAYVLGRGAFDAKYILRGDSMVTRYMYREVRRLISDRQKTAWRNLLWLLKGFVHYVWFRLTHPRSRPEKIALQNTIQPQVK
jgi:glycosyltransferase involved in cell wall biosynthesis